MLNYKKLGAGQPLLILHGFLGTLDNWQSLGNQFAENFEVYLIDQRNHGRSPHYDSHSYPEMTNDLKQFVDQLELRELNIIGHSMGGKTAMFFSQAHESLVHRMVIVDIAPKAYPVRHQSILDALNGVNLDGITSRKLVEEQLSSGISEPGVRQFLMKNLYRKDDSTFGWRMNLGTLTRALPKVGDALPEGVNNTPTLFLHGSRSDYILPEDEPSIRAQFTNAKIEKIAGAGHWVHAERPVEFFEKASSFLSLNN